MDRYQKRVLILRNHVLNNSIGKSKATQEPIKEVKEDVNTIAYEDMTKTEIGELLDEKDIEYSLRDNKAKLIDLLLGSD